MTEILFGESESAALKEAQTFEKAIGEVVSLPYMLDIGDISQPPTSEKRRRLLSSMLYREQWGSDEEMKNELRGVGDRYALELDKLKRLMGRGGAMRIWYCSAPYSVCGMMWLCGLLARYEGAVYAVEMPRRTVGEDTITERSALGELEPREFAELLGLQRRMTPLEVRSFSMEWERLVRENAPLRAVINGTVIGVPTSFYDFMIWKNLDVEPIAQAALIGRILCKNQVGVSDWWFAARIERLIRHGKIKVVEDSDKKYARKICLCDTQG